MQTRPLLGGTLSPPCPWRAGRDEPEERGGAARERDAEMAAAASAVVVQVDGHRVVLPKEVGVVLSTRFDVEVLEQLPA